MTLLRFSFLLILMVLLSCGNHKEKELIIREKELLEKEKKFSDKEAEYKLLLKMKDSLLSVSNIKDTLPIQEKWPDSLNGSWNAKMVCRESNCSIYVIGDQRNEIWDFVSDSSGTYANVIGSNKLKRILRGKYLDHKIILDSSLENSSKNTVKINAVLDDIRKNIIKGTQTITGKDNCTAKFSVELTPSSKK